MNLLGGAKPVSGEHAWPGNMMIMVPPQLGSVRPKKFRVCQMPSVCCIDKTPRLVPGQTHGTVNNSDPVAIQSQCSESESVAAARRGPVEILHYSTFFLGRSPSTEGPLSLRLIACW